MVPRQLYSSKPHSGSFHNIRCDDEEDDDEDDGTFSPRSNVGTSSLGVVMDPEERYPNASSVPWIKIIQNETMVHKSICRDFSIIMVTKSSFRDGEGEQESSKQPCDHVRRRSL